MFDTYLAEIHSDEFAYEWADFCATLDEVMKLHMEEEYVNC